MWELFGVVVVFSFAPLDALKHLHEL